jgi:6-phosphofructokinase 1
MNVAVLGTARYPSPLQRWVSDSERVPATIVRTVDARPADGLLFELAGARETLFFNPPETRAGVVTCGGLCPGLNDVIRSLFLEMHYAYGVKEVLGFRWGYQGLDPERGAEPLILTADTVDRIHLQAGTILGTSRGPVDKARAVENLIRRRVNILFAIGGDGTQRGAREFFEEAQKRGYPLSVVGIPKNHR